MNAIIDKIDLWTTAQELKTSNRGRSASNQSLLGIKKLRELILELAVRGKLLPQDPNDESAKVLLKKAEVERTRLVKEGRFKKLEVIHRTGQDERLTELPKGWEWAYIPQVVLNEKYAIKRGPFGSSIRKDFFVTAGYKVYEQQNAIYDDFSLGEYYLNESKFNELKAFEVKPNDIIISCSGTVGKVAIAPEWMEKGIINQALLKISLNEAILTNNYFKILFPAFYMKTDTLSELKGTAQKNMVSVDTLKNEPFPLPPLADQHRIVAKVDELMVLCDELENQQTNSNIAHEILVATLLGSLTKAENSNSFDESWQRIANHFDILFTTEHSINQLKQNILQLAVMGKLVPQNPEEEPAIELLKKIDKEKVKLTKEGKIKKQSHLSEISDDEKPFALPKGWEWVRLGATGLGSTGKTPSTNNSKYFNGEIPFLGPGQITPDGRIVDSDKSLTEEGVEYSTIADSGDILMVCIGGSIGKSAIVKSRIAFNQQLNCIRPLKVSSFYLYLTINAPFFQSSILSFASGSATPIINRSKWEDLPIPLPPITEQLNIVSKVDELFAFCDGLKEGLFEAQTLQNQLAVAVVEQALN